jgi:hypothetical protein
MKRLGLFLLVLTLFVGTGAAQKSVNMDSLKREVVANSKEIHDIKKDSIMYSKLSPNQIAELKKQELEVRKQEIEKDSRLEMPLNGFQIFMICLLPFVFVGAIIVIKTGSQKEEAKRRYDLYTKSLEMGQAVPEHFFDEPKKVSTASNLKKGILWFMIGLALLISFIVMGHNRNSLIVGIIPTFVGAGYLLVHFLEKPKTDSTVNDNEQHG